MDNKLDKILGGGPMSAGKMTERDAQAKMDVIKELMAEMLELMGGRVHDGLDEMQKVTVAAPDEASLKEGLEIAQEVVPEVEPEAPMEMASIPEDDDEDDADDLFSMMQRKKKLLKG